MIHSKGFMRSGTVVGSFKIDLKTVYDAAGTWTFYMNVYLKHEYHIPFFLLLLY